MRIADFKGEEGLDVLAEILEPSVGIMTDEGVKKLYEGNDKIKLISYILKNHKKEVLTIMAVLNRENPATYEPNILELPKLLLELFNDPDLLNLFSRQAQKEGETASGSATETTAENGR